MKFFFNNIMKVNIETNLGTDYSGIAFLRFLLENSDNLANKVFTIYDFSTYLYRFYSDIPKACSGHYNKMINNIFHYSPSDLNIYSAKYLSYLEEHTSLLKVYNSCFILNLTLKAEAELYTNYNLFNELIDFITTKYLGLENKDYNTNIRIDEFKGISVFDDKTRVFNRIIERRNYCFICDEYQRNNLLVVRICNEKYDKFDSSCYILMCKKHSNEYLTKNLIIKKNGYAYINNERILSHIAIDELKIIRHNL